MITSIKTHPRSLNHIHCRTCSYISQALGLFLKKAEGAVLGPWFLFWTLLTCAVQNLGLQEDLRTPSVMLRGCSPRSDVHTSDEGGTEEV